MVSPVITLFNRENSQGRVGFSLPFVQEMFINICPSTVPAVGTGAPKAD